MIFLKHKGVIVIFHFHGHFLLFCCHGAVGGRAYAVQKLDFPAVDKDRSLCWLGFSMVDVESVWGRAKHLLDVSFYLFTFCHFSISKSRGGGAGEILSCTIGGVVWCLLIFDQHHHDVPKLLWTSNSSNNFLQLIGSWRDPQGA